LLSDKSICEWVNNTEYSDKVKASTSQVLRSNLRDSIKAAKPTNLNLPILVTSNQSAVPSKGIKVDNKTGNKPVKKLVCFLWELQVIGLTVNNKDRISNIKLKIAHTTHGRIDNHLGIKCEKIARGHDKNGT